mmetsp:Transcript_5021/g.7791  ORF Transcript_5021/g.7791 Transcript_5021/m.7791 type:complete len:774 (+) Transcript_5021:56-2377(+)
MGQGSSHYSGAVLSENRYLDQLVGVKSYPVNDPFWSDLWAFKVKLSSLATDEVESVVRKLCVQFVTNNRSTGNFQTLCEHMLDRLKTVSTAPKNGGSTVDSEAATEAANIVFLVHIFAKHFIEYLEHDTLSAQFGLVYPLPSGVAEQRQRPLAYRIVEDVMSFLSDVDVTMETYLVHLELLNLLLILFSTQMYSPVSSIAPNLFLDIAMGSESPSISNPSAFVPVSSPSSVRRVERNADFVGALVANYMERKTGPYVAPPSKSQSVGVVTTLASAATSIMLLPYYAYLYFFSGKHDYGSNAPLADRSLLVLLVLVHYRTDPDAINNPFRTALQGFQDTYYDPADPESGSVAPGVIRIPFATLYDTLGPNLRDERTTLLCYCLLHGNPHFLTYVLARTDLDTLLLPLLHMLYNAQERKPNQIYMLLIILLILTQDAAFNATIHTLMIPSVPWFKERILQNVSLGSLAVIVFVRTIQYNLVKLRDTYLHTNCLAALANMAPHFHNLHSYAAQRLVALFCMLAHRHDRITRKLQNPEANHPVSRSSSSVSSSSYIPPNDNSSHPPPSLEALQQELMVYTDFLRIVLETINACVTYALPRNVNLIYALLQRQPIFASFRTHPRLYDLIENVEAMLTFVSQRLDEAQLPLPWQVQEVLGVLEQSIRSWKGDRLRMFPELRFTYEEEARPEEFFTPYVWSLVYQHATIVWNSERIVLFSSSSLDAEAPGLGFDAPQPEAARGPSAGGMSDSLSATEGLDEIEIRDTPSDSPPLVSGHPK